MTFSPCPKPERTPPKARRPLPRQTKPIPKRNPKRSARVFAEDFGSKAYIEALHAKPCAVCSVFGWTVAGHTKSRGAGGKVEDLVPLCASRFLGTPQAVVGCHELFDARDPEVRQHELLLRTLAKQLWKNWNANGQRFSEPFLSGESSNDTIGETA